MTMGHTDVSKILLNGMSSALETWKGRLNGSPDTLFWVLRINLAETGLIDGPTPERVRGEVPAELSDVVERRFRAGMGYWADVRYASLEPVTQLWGTVVNGLRVVAGSDRATDTQKQVFDYEEGSLLNFLRAARERMEVADQLYHAFKAMPAPECQALAALLNVHVHVPLDVETMCRLVRLLDHEGPMSDEEHEYFASLSNTHLVDAAFRGLRGSA
jgi:hypothetical protein